MRLTTVSIATATLVAALNLAACGNGAKAPAAADNSVSATTGAPDASAPAGQAAAAPAEDCSYISPAQLSAIEGATYAKPTAFHSICGWIGSDGNALSITVTRNASEADWQSTLATVQGDQSSGPPAPIPGLGDRAAGVGLEIAVQKGGTIVDIRNGDSPGFGKWPKSAAIANAIFAGQH